MTLTSPMHGHFDLDSMLQRRLTTDWELGTHISLKHRYVFLKVAKAASSTITEHLQRVEFAGSPFRVQNPRRKHLSPHLSPYQLPADQMADIMDDSTWPKVTFVRNPYTRTLSCYLHRIVASPSSPSARCFRRWTGAKETPSFARFVEVICGQESVDMERHWRLQADEALDGFVELDFVGRFEQRDDDLKMLSELLFGEQLFDGLDEVDGSPMRTGAASKLDEYYTGDLAGMIAERFARDFEKFGYSPELSRAQEPPRVPSQKFAS